MNSQDIKFLYLANFGFIGKNIKLSNAGFSEDLI